MACNLYPPLWTLTGCKYPSFPRLRPLSAPSRSAVGVLPNTPAATFFSKASRDA
jgi:hypothetical protein